MPAFAFRHVKELYPVFWSKSREMVERLKEASKSPVPTSETKNTASQDPEKSAADATVHAPGAVEVAKWSSRATLGIAILSYCGSLQIGLLADGDTFADLDVLATGLEDAFAELRKVADDSVRAAEEPLDGPR